MTNEERQSLFEFISKNKNNPEIIKNFLSSCQILIDYIQKENFNKNHSLFNIIQNLPDYIELDDKFKNLFRQQISLMSLRGLLIITAVPVFHPSLRQMSSSTTMIKQWFSRMFW